MARETIPSLHNAFLGRPLETDIWENDAFIGGRVRTEGEPACASANWCTTAAAVALYARRDYARGWWLQYFDQAAYRFMGKEPFSRIYAHWMAFPVMYVAYHAYRGGDDELFRRAKEWLRAFWTYLCIAGVDHDQQNQFDNRNFFPSLATSFCGARSFERGDDAQGNKHRGAPYHIDNWITGAVLKRALYGTSFPPGWFEDELAELRTMEAGSFVWSCLTEDERQTLVRILRGQIGAPEIAAIRSWIGPFKTLPTYRLVRTAAGVTLYLEKLAGTGTSGATAPVYGCYTTPGGEQQWLAPDSGFRPAGELARTAVSFGETRVENGRVHAARGDGQVFREDTEALKHSIPLPTGAPILELRFGPGGLEVLQPGGHGDPVPAPAPGPAPTPAPRPSTDDGPDLPAGEWISAEDFARFAHDRYFRHLPPGSDARKVFEHLLRTVYLLMNATDPVTAALRLDPDTRRQVEETIANFRAQLRDR
jgi:hypothetical protein